MNTKRIIVSLAIIACVSNLAADEFSLGGKQITVPAPKGFVRITDDMARLQPFVVMVTDSMNDTLAVYVPEDLAALTSDDELPEFERHLVLKIEKHPEIKSSESMIFNGLKKRLNAKIKRR